MLTEAATHRQDLHDALEGGALACIRAPAQLHEFLELWWQSSKQPHIGGQMVTLESPAVLLASGLQHSSMSSLKCGGN